MNDQAPVWDTKGGKYEVIENQQFIIDLNASDDFPNSIIFSLDTSKPDHEFLTSINRVENLSLNQF